MKPAKSTSDRIQHRSRTVSQALSIAYFALAALGLAGTWYFNIVYIAVDGGIAYLHDWFANAASSSAAIDVIVTAIVACAFYAREIRRLGWTRWALVLVPLTFAVALALTFPLFLAFRERTLLRQYGTGSPTSPHSKPLDVHESYHGR